MTTATTEAKFENAPLTQTEVAGTMERVLVADEWYSIAILGEEVESFLVLGLLTDDEIRAAVRRYVDWFDIEVDDARVAQGWTVFTRHRPGCNGFYEPAEPDLGPCSCEADDSPVWWYDEVLSHVAEANAKRPGAIAVTELSF